MVSLLNQMLVVLVLLSLLQNQVEFKFVLKIYGVWIMAFTTVDDPSKYFQVTTYTSNGSVASVTNVGNSDLQPD